jgi:hypothetical protein
MAEADISNQIAQWLTGVMPDYLTGENHDETGSFINPFCNSFYNIISDGF